MDTNILSFREIDEMLKGVNCEIKRYYVVTHVYYCIEFKGDCSKKECNKFYDLVYSKVGILLMDEDVLCFKKDFSNKEDELYVCKQFLYTHDDYDLKTTEINSKYERVNKIITFEEIDRIINKYIKGNKECIVERVYYEEGAKYSMYLRKVSEKLIQQLYNELSTKIYIHEKNVIHIPNEKDSYFIEFTKKYVDQNDRFYIIGQCFDDKVMVRKRDVNDIFVM